jgi:hypothetical protein
MEVPSCEKAVTELIVGLAISLALFAVVIGMIEIVVDRYVGGSRTSSSAQRSHPGAR